VHVYKSSYYENMQYTLWVRGID